MSNSAQLTKHQIVSTFSGIASELEDIIEKQEDRLKFLKDHEQMIRKFLGEQYPSNPLKQEREAKDWLRVAVWREYFPLKAQTQKNKELLSRMKRRNNFSSEDADSQVDVEDVKGVPISYYLDFNSHNKAQCIWHDDHNPSLHYYEDDNRVHCFSCGEGGDVIDVVQELHDCTFKQALTELK